MSNPSVHIAQSLVSVAVLYPVLGENAIVFGASILLIDTDHIIEYVADTKNFHPKGFFVYNDLWHKNLDKNFKKFHLLHTIECYLFLFGLAQIYPVFNYVLGGFLFHYLFDLITLFRVKQPFLRAYSIFGYLMLTRKKGYIISMRELIMHDDVNLENIPNLEYWLRQWGIYLEPDKQKKLACSKVR